VKTLFLAALLVAGCATTPKPESPLPVSQITPDAAREGGIRGERVRWGGVIVDVEPKESETCFEISSRPLDSSGRPLDTDDNYGRFIACSDRFYDPAVYVPRREVSVVGTLSGSIKGKVGERDYSFPKVETEDVYLWPRFSRSYAPYRYYDPFYDPFWDPFYRHRFGYSRFPFYPRCFGCL
jgi:outer membrane lipoprotein